jgi:predicted kinase
MKKILILKGLPASGKSSFALELLSKEPNSWKRINKDLLRAMFDNGVYSSKNEEFIDSVMYSAMKAALLKGYNIIHDNTNLSQKVFDRVCEIAKSLGDISVEEMIFPTSLQECISRDNNRQQKVGKDVIMRMYNQYSLSEGYPEPRMMEFPKQSELSSTEQNKSLPKCIVCDIDGTVALMDRSPYDTSKADADLPNEEIINIVKYYYLDNYKIFFVSGRDKQYTQITTEWLNKYIQVNSKPIEYSLYLRDDNDKRADTIYKKEVYMNKIYNKYYVSCWIDDRPKVCRMVREDLKLLVLQVNHKEF